jgi:tetratricopeptide (TPR) repeat protein
MAQRTIDMKKTGMASVILLTFAAAALFPSCKGEASSGTASVSEKKEIIKTYPFSDPDPVPIFARPNMRGQGARLYPYYFYNQFSGVGVDKEWTVVRLENPYLSVAVLPQVGGKVWGAREKSTNREFLYTNHVLKFREIALRGPWTSGGIEFNFGIVGHAPSTATPVDYALRRNADGSASCIVGAMDLPSRTRWSVAITMPKDKAYFETNGAWHNPSPFSQSYYFWSCAAIKTADDLKYVFPGRFQIGHDYAVPLAPWPADAQGRDLSWYRNNDFGGSKSYFTVGEYENFYGAWYKNSDAGFGHWALYDDMPGRKVWIWDESRAGEIWVDLLTDTDGQYTEPQAGRLLNQSDHEFFKPGRSDRWQELWFPYKGIGPMAEASPYGVLNVKASGNSIQIGLFALQKLDEDITVSSSGKELFREPVKLKPENIYKKDLTLELGGAAFVVKVGEKLIYRSDPAADDLQRPLRFKAADESTAEGLYLSGAQQEKARYFDMALQKYLACLAKEPAHLRALSRVAELYARRGEYPKALGYARKALENSMYDPEANYIYGVISRRLGDLIDAKETLGWASRSLEFRPAAYLQLAEIAFVENKTELAAQYAQRSIDFNAYESGAYEILAAAYRKMGKVEAAKDVLARLLDFDPLDHMARFELYLLDPTPKNLDAFKSMIRNELPQETYLEMAITYMRWRCDSDAAAVLRNAPEYPTVYYMLSRLLMKEFPDESKTYLGKASALSPLLVFPFREEEIPLFEWAMAVRPTDWKPKYYLGLIFWGKGRLEEAMELFEQCDAADFAPFFLARAELFRQRSPEKAAADYERAVSLDETAWRNWHALIDFRTKSGETGKALEAAQKAARLFAKTVPVQVDLVKSFISAKKYEDAATVLDAITALPFEGASEIHGLFAQTHVQLGLEGLRAGNWTAAIGQLERSKEYPESLGTGKPFDPDCRLQDYFEFLAFQKTGQKDKAEAALQAVIDYTFKHPDSRGSEAYFGGLALRRKGETAKAAEILMNAALPSKEILDTLRTLGS